MELFPIYNTTPAEVPEAERLREKVEFEIVTEEESSAVPTTPETDVD